MWMNKEQGKGRYGIRRMRNKKMKKLASSPTCNGGRRRRSEEKRKGEWKECTIND